MSPAVQAFHLKWDEMKLDSNVAKWAVSVLNLSKTRRHLDRATLMTIWEKLDKYVVSAPRSLVCSGVAPVHTGEGRNWALKVIYVTCDIGSLRIRPLHKALLV